MTPSLISTGLPPFSRPRARPGGTPSSAAASTLKDPALQPHMQLLASTRAIRPVAVTEVTAVFGDDRICHSNQVLWYGLNQNPNLQIPKALPL